MSAARTRLRVPDEIRDVIGALHPETRRKVRAALGELLLHPDTGLALTRRLAGYRRIRIGGWRIVYRVAGPVIEVHAIGRRSTVYADLIARVERGVEEPPPRRLATIRACSGSAIAAPPASRRRTP